MVAMANIVSVSHIMTGLLCTRILPKWSMQTNMAMVIDIWKKLVINHATQCTTLFRPMVFITCNKWNIICERFDMPTMWVSHVYHMGITCTPCGYHMYTTWVSHIHHIGITCTPCGYHMYTTWVSHIHHIGITCTPCGYHMYTTWIAHAHHMGVHTA